jgi:hypothetical protein
MLVYNNILLNNGFVMPYSMNIDDYSILFFDDVDIDIFVFPDNEGIDMVSHLTIFLHFAHPFHLSSFKRQWNHLSSFFGL